RKYLRALDLGALPPASEFTQAFHAHYERALGVAMLALTGFPRGLVEKVGPRRELLDLVRLIMELARAGMPRRLPDDPAALQTTGSYDVGAILVTLAHAHADTRCDAQLAAYIDAASLRGRLLAVYRDAAA